ncbi:hypothetical protein L529_4950, partial [Bordetella bronchiseptica MBORD901]
MTTHNNATQAADLDFVTTELCGIIDVCEGSPTAIVSVERMRLWLPKLRAPVADEPQPDDLNKQLFEAAIRDLAAISEHLGLDPDEGGAEPIIEAIDELRRERDGWVDAQYAAAGDAAPQASPVAGEAVAWAVFAPNGNIRYWHHDKANVEAFAAKHGLPVTGIADAAPQAPAGWRWTLHPAG